ncbi:phage Gp37/Gp68 family protein [Amaricoccus sp. HAR-UPW-R2A-40]|nr:phage Gp37/Gp68 family protein [Amaricoccus sp. HAR-UPW-R2A-40]
MAEKTSIEWTRGPDGSPGATWNPITGCTLVSEGCRHCYAAQLAATRLKNHPSRAGLARLNAAGEAKFTGEVRLNEQWLVEPLRWRRPRRIFVCAHGDLFHEGVPDEWVDRVFAVMALAPQHTFQVLTKRPERARSYMLGLELNWERRLVDRGAADFGDEVACFIANFINGWIAPRGTPFAGDPANGSCERWPLPHVWLGTSVEDEATADARIPHLLAAPAAVRFLSAEPLLGPVDLTEIAVPRPDLRASVVLDVLRGWGGPINRLDWVIVGGESGKHARPMHPDWVRALRDQCQAAGVAFFFKQWGEWVPGEIAGPNTRSIDAATWWDRQWMIERVGPARPDDHIDDEPDLFRVGKKAAGRVLDGRTWDQMPREPQP